MADDMGCNQRSCHGMILQACVYMETPPRKLISEIIRLYLEALEGDGGFELEIAQYLLDCQTKMQPGYTC